MPLYRNTSTQNLDGFTGGTMLFPGEEIELSDGQVKSNPQVSAHLERAFLTPVTMAAADERPVEAAPKADAVDSDGK